MGEHGRWTPPSETRLIRKAKDLALGGMMGALGVLLPIAFHSIAGAGPVFLPMYLPVLACGLLVSSWEVALIVGVLTPFVSGALTGMPPMIPHAPVMAVELGALAVTACLARGLGANVWVASVVALLARAVLRPLIYVVGADWLGIDAPFTVWAFVAILEGWPGMALLLSVVPGTVLLVERQSVIARARRGDSRDEAGPDRASA